ncbi:hypothetical protein LTR95_013907 [Oleoguttula sp. CCFEE 5521]
MSARSLSLREGIERDGYVIVPSGLTAIQLDDLRSASKMITKRARDGYWSHIRTLPRQFPPWLNDPSNGIWGVQQLMHPDLPGSDVFTASYFSKPNLETVKSLLDCEADDLVMELYNLLTRPDENFELRWHRDDIPPTATAKEEAERLRKPAYHAQWNLALYPDSSLILVPGSHRRPLTDAERTAGPYEANMPNQIHVKLEAGEMAFYNNNILHRGSYRSDVERMTLHGSMGHVAGGSLRARNVLQHGREWIDSVDLSRVEDRRAAEGMRDRLVQLASQYEDVGFTHND